MVNYKDLGLVNTREMFKRAVAGGYAIPAFNFNTMEQMQAIVQAAVETKSPVIMQVSKGARNYANGTILRYMAEGAVRLSIKAFDQEGNEVSEGDTRPYRAMLSAFRNKDGKLAVVATNYSEHILPIIVDVDGNSRLWQMYRTSDISAESLLPIGTTTGKTTLAPRSITTFVEL